MQVLRLSFLGRKSAEGVENVPEFLAVCRAEAVRQGRGLTVEVQGRRIAILNDAGQFHALTDRCPHAGGSLGQGWVEDGEAVCPLHRWRFRLKTGRCSTARGHSLHQYACKLRDGMVWVAF
ncbi:nitrite reductase small subunit NirD [soil metagenome]